MNSLQRTLIEKTGNDNGFEHVLASDNWLIVSSSNIFSASLHIIFQPFCNLCCHRLPSPFLNPVVVPCL